MLLYNNYSRDLDGEFEGNFSYEDQISLIQKNLDRLRLQLLVVNGITLGLVSVISFFLSGLTLKPIKESMDREKRFISDVAHELRTPLSVLKTEIEVALRDPNISGLEKEILKSNLEETEKLIKLTNDLLYIFQMERRCC